MLIEQAIFASLQSDRAHGYHLAARSRGLTDGDARELALWGPSHDSLLPGATVSTNFHRLTSGWFCVSRTEPAGAEYSGRGGAGIYTQMLVVPPETMARFANNPFALARAALAIGALAVREEIPAELQAFKLSGRAAAVDVAILPKLIREPGAHGLAALVDAMLAHEQVAVAWNGSMESLFAGLFSLLPVECRAEFSLASGLKYSTGRPTRLLAAPADDASQRNLARHGYAVVDLNCIPDCERELSHPWARHVYALLSGGRLSALATELNQPRPELTCEHLGKLTDSLDLDGFVPAPREPSGGAISAPRGSHVPSERGETVTEPQHAPATATCVHFDLLRADAPHASNTTSRETATTSTVDSLERLLAAQPPEVVEMLERIDDLVFAAVAGSDSALEELKVRWPQTMAQLNPEVAEETVAQYLRCVLSLYERCGETDNRRPERAMNAISVFCVLFAT